MKFGGGREIDMTQGRALKVIVQFTLPMLVGNFLSQLYNVVDTAIVGRAISANALAAVGSSATVLQVLNMFIFGLSVGLGVIVAQYWSAKRYEELSGVIGAMETILIILILLVSAIGFIFSNVFLQWMHVPEELMEDAVLYMRIVIGLSFGQAVYMQVASILRSIGDSTTPLIAIISSSGINIGLDLILILWLRMGVAGAAIATVAAQVFSALVCVVVLMRKKTDLNFRTIRPNTSLRYLKSLVTYALPASLQSGLVCMGSLCVQYLVNGFGSVVMAAYTTAGKMDNLVFMVVCSVSGAMSVFAGQNKGVDNTQRIKEGLRQTMFLQLAICIALAFIIIFGRYRWMELFLNKQTETEAIRLGAQYLSVMIVGYFICAIMNTYLDTLRGAGDATVSVISGIVELATRIALTILLSAMFGVWGVWIATPISWGCGCIIPLVRYYSGKWMMLKKV